MKNIILATAGHIDHGKSTLIKNLTGKDTMHHKEEKIRNITIDLGYANLKTRDLNINIIDVPGHRDYLKNTICGILNANIILLVISAKDGLCKQTYEHFQIINYCLIDNLIIAITKTDLADDKSIQNTIFQSQDLIKKSSIKNTDISIIDYKDKNSLNTLIDKIYNLSLNINIPQSNKIIFKIDNSFTVKGYGTVISGNLISGQLKNQDRLMIYPQKLKTKIKNLQNNQKNVDSINQFSRVAINISNIEKDKIYRGNIVSTSFDIENTNIIDVLISTSNLKRTIKNYEFVKIYTGTSNVSGKIINLQDKTIKANTKTIIQLRLQESINCFLKDDVIILDTSNNDIIAGGQIINVKGSKKSKLETILSDYSLDKLILLFIFKENKIINTKDLIDIYNINKNLLECIINELIKDKYIIKISKENIHFYENVFMDYTFFKKVKLQINNLINEYLNKFKYKKDISLDTIYNKLDYLDKKYIDVFLHYINLKVDKNILILQNANQDTDFKQRYSFIKNELNNSTKPIQIKNIIKDDKLTKQILYDNFSKDFSQISNEYICTKKVLNNYLDTIDKHFETNKTISISEFKQYIGLSRNLSVIILEYFDMQKITKRFENYRVRLYNNILN